MAKLKNDPEVPGTGAEVTDPAMEAVTIKRPAKTDEATLIEPPVAKQPNTVVSAQPTGKMVSVADGYRWNTIQVAGREFSRTPVEVHATDEGYAEILANPYLKVV